MQQVLNFLAYYLSRCHLHDLLIDFENLLPASSYDVMPSSEEISKYGSSVMDSKLYTESFSAPDPQKPYEEMPSSVPLLGGK